MPVVKKKDILIVDYEEIHLTHVESSTKVVSWYCRQDLKSKHDWQVREGLHSKSDRRQQEAAMALRLERARVYPGQLHIRQNRRSCV